MLVIIDFGAGNLGSVEKAFRHLGAHPVVSNDPKVIAKASQLVLPGVGAFRSCINGLQSVGLVESVRAFIATQRPFLGICVGMQMLFEIGEEMGETAGLSVLQGRVVRFNFGAHRTAPLKIPHIGWNTVHFAPDAALFRGLPQGERAYFVHSFHALPSNPEVVSATTCYGYEFCAAVQQGSVHATQFHPEKSGSFGLEILRNFAQLSA
jgi:glutamine amidotransferase